MWYADKNWLLALFLYCCPTGDPSISVSPPTRTGQIILSYEEVVTQSVSTPVVLGLEIFSGALDRR